MMRALVPVNLRPLEKAYKLGNRVRRWSSSSCRSASSNPIERLYAVRANMGALKDSYQPILALGLLRGHGRGAASCCRTSCSTCSRATRPR